MLIPVSHLSEIMSVKMDAKLRHRVRMAAARQAISDSDIVRKAIDAYLPPLNPAEDSAPSATPQPMR